jgi:hydrogenase-1 operon protein HyaF
LIDLSNDCFIEIFTMAHSPAAFPIPVVAFGNGSAMEDETLDCLPMPQEMAVFRAPLLPEREELVSHGAALTVLTAVQSALRLAQQGEAVAPISLAGLGLADLAVVNQLLGEGEVSAQVLPRPGALAQVHVQESVFAGVWRVVHHHDNGTVVDTIEVGAIPLVLRLAAADDAAAGPGDVPALPPGLVNVPSLLEELANHRQHWRPGQPAEVMNLSLLPLSAADIGALDSQLGTGRVLILSRGYGNCRITNTCRSHTWRVVYYNSQDKAILNSVEVTDLPEVACAAREDLGDSLERLTEVLAWVDGG